MSVLAYALVKLMRLPPETALNVAGGIAALMGFLDFGIASRRKNAPPACGFTQATTDNPKLTWHVTPDVPASLVPALKPLRKPKRKGKGKP